MTATDKRRINRGGGHRVRRALIRDAPFVLARPSAPFASSRGRSFRCAPTDGVNNALGGLMTEIYIFAGRSRPLPPPSPPPSV